MLTPNHEQGQLIRGNKSENNKSMIFITFSKTKPFISQELSTIQLIKNNNYSFVSKQNKQGFKRIDNFHKFKLFNKVYPAREIF